MTKKRLTTHCSVLKVMILALLGVFLLMFDVAPIFASSFIGFENSEGYILGAINGQQNWSGIGTSNVVDDKSYSGSNSLKMSCCGGLNWALKDFGTLETGSLKFYFYTESGAKPYLISRNSSNQDLFYSALSENGVMFQWNYGEVEWLNSSDIQNRKWRYKVNDYVSDWFNFSTSNSGAVSKIFFAVSGAVDSLLWYDNLNYVSPMCGEGYCNLCDFYGCLANSDKCCWTIDTCLEGACYIGGGTCGSGANLMFCETEESCENYGGYWWEGTCSGYQKPYLPPEDVCEGLGTIEKWLCEIKNLLKGIFVPSTEKTEELRQTIDIVKQKFPMNYLSVSQSFLGDVKNSINSSGDIDFKILGQTGTVNFAFWEKTTDIGGATQKIGEVIKVFITFLVILAFILWAISFGRRIF